MLNLLTALKHCAYDAYPKGLAKGLPHGSGCGAAKSMLKYANFYLRDNFNLTTMTATLTTTAHNFLLTLGYFFPPICFVLGSELPSAVPLTPLCSHSPVPTPNTMPPSPTVSAVLYNESGKGGGKERMVFRKWEICKQSLAAFKGHGYALSHSGDHNACAHVMAPKCVVFGWMVGAQG